MNTRYFRIHGDNIVECERTLKMLAEAFEAKYSLLESPIYMPKYIIKTTSCNFEVELLSGHGRWGGIDLGKIIFKAGGKLEESADSYLTEIIENQEVVLLGIEYCSALPAGNNAWQRNGRALASVLANVPYLYYAEIGGIELDDNREPKAPRYPNPAVPFSYITLSQDMNSVCLPVYRAHPSMTQRNLTIYEQALGYKDGLDFIRKMINGEDTTTTVICLKNKAIKMVEILSQNRKKKDTLGWNQWNILLSSNDRPSWLEQNYKENWSKKSSDKVKVSNTFEQLKTYIKSLSAVAITAKDLPMCIIPKDKLTKLKAWIYNNYNGLEANFDTSKDLAIVWITGFKPRGDDSRPDRGLSPLCRMLLGKEANIMAIVSGPAKEFTWNLLKKSPVELCKSNGLFQAIFSFCNYLLVDSATCDYYLFIPTGAVLEKNENIISFPSNRNPHVDFSEHDIDCGIHQILSNQRDLGIYECFCNPPGGDWSGISYFDGNIEFKWTSLPRVSEASKRPDHLFQIVSQNQLIFVTIESKGEGKNLEDNIGNRLKDYINELFTSEPTAFTNVDKNNWQFFSGNLTEVNYKMISVGAFLYKNESELANLLDRGNLDAIFAFEFDGVSTLHFYSNENGKILIGFLNTIASKLRNFVVKVH